jgi:hypothetical protein
MAISLMQLRELSKIREMEVRRYVRRLRCLLVINALYKCFTLYLFLMYDSKCFSFY